MNRTLVMIVAAASLSACSDPNRGDWLGFMGDKVVFGSEQEGYVACLTYAMRGDHNLTADEIRSLCEEVAGVTNEHWLYDDDADELVPGNEYTRCIQEEEKALQSLGEERAARLAKLSCKYPEYK